MSALTELQALRNVIRNRRDQMVAILKDSEDKKAAGCRIAFDVVLEDINRQITALLFEQKKDAA